MNIPHLPTIRYLKEKEVAALLGLAVQTLRNYRFKGIGPTYCKVGRAVRYPLPDVIQFMEGNKISQRVVTAT